MYKTLNYKPIPFKYFTDKYPYCNYLGIYGKNFNDLNHRMDKSPKVQNHFHH